MIKELTEYDLGASFRPERVVMGRLNEVIRALNAMERQPTGTEHAKGEICSACDPENCDIQAVLESGGRYCVECGRKLSPVG